jgi:sec-independent protein translocase protein TatA
MAMTNSLLFFNLGGGEIFFILFIVLLLFGSKKIPEFARGMGKGIRYLKNATDDIQRDIQDTVDDVKKDVDINKKLRDNS